MPVYGQLTEEFSKEKLSLAFIEAVAAVAGCVTSRPDPDTGIDLTISQERDFGVYSESKVDVQAKSTKNGSWVTGHLAFDVPIENYDDLRVADVLVPRILVVLIVPAQRETWLTDLDDLTELRHAAYWVSLRSAPASGNSYAKTVYLPRAQRFTVESLCDILQRIANDESL